MRSCPSCGAPAKPADKFCGQCGYPRVPEPGLSSQETEGECGGKAATGRKRKVLVIAVAIAIVIIGIAAGAMLTMEHGNNSESSVAANQSTGSRSYVIVETEEPVTTTQTTLPVIVTTSLTTLPAVTKTPKVGTCPADRRLCGTNCTDTLTDRNNCGYCNTQCQQGQACVNGHCMLDCPTGKTACVEGCFNLKTNPDHCGICANDCPTGLICSNGQCSPAPTFTIRAI